MDCNTEHAQITITYFMNHTPSYSIEHTHYTSASVLLAKAVASGQAGQALA